MNLDFVRRHLEAPLAALVGVGGVLIAAGSQWNLVSNFATDPGRPVSSRHLAIMTAPKSAVLVPYSGAEWLPLLLLVAGIVLASLGFDAGAARTRSPAMAWSFLAVAACAGISTAVLGLLLTRSTSTAGPGYFLVLGGCLVGCVGAGLIARSSSGRAVEAVTPC